MAQCKKDLSDIFSFFHFIVKIKSAYRNTYCDKIFWLKNYYNWKNFNNQYQKIKLSARGIYFTWHLDPSCTKIFRKNGYFVSAIRA